MQISKAWSKVFTSPFDASNHAPSQWTQLEFMAYGSHANNSFPNLDYLNCEFLHVRCATDQPESIRHLAATKIRQIHQTWEFNASRPIQH